MEKKNGPEIKEYYKVYRLPTTPGLQQQQPGKYFADDRHLRSDLILFNSILLLTTPAHQNSLFLQIPL